MDFTKIPKADLSKNNFDLDEQLDKDLSQLGKKIEIVKSNGSGKRKMDDSFINKNKSFLARQDQFKKIKDKQEKGELISNQEASLLKEMDLKKNKSNFTEKKFEEKKDISENNFVEMDDENKQVNLDDLKEKADLSFQKLLEKETEFQKIKEKRGFFQKTQAFFGIGKNKESHINKEFEDSKKVLEELQKEYQNNYQEFANKMVAEKKENVQFDQQKQLKEILKNYILTEDVVKGIKKKEDGSEEEKMFSLLGYLNQNEKKLLEKRQETLSEKRKGVLKTAWEKYNSLSKKEKMIYGVGISSTVGATIMLGGGAAMGTALGYGAWQGGKTLLKRLAVGAVGGAIFSGVASLSNKEADRVKSNYKIERDEKIVGGFEKNQGNLFEVLNEYNKKEKRVNLTKKGVLVLTGVGLAGTALGMDGLVSSLDNIDNIDGLENDGLSQDVKFKETKIPEDKDLKVDKEPEEKTITSNKPIKSDKNLGENYEAEESEKGLRLNSSFELAKGGNVWNSLSENFDGDRQKVGNVLAGFRAETMKDLMENHGMSEVQADQFIEWRYRHMDVGTDFSLKDGKLKIPGFDDERKIAQFGKTEFNNPNSINDTMKNAGESGAERLNNTTTKKTVDISKPTETVKILDPKISAQVDQNINNLVKDIYGRQSYEWDVMKNKNALDVINSEYGNPIKEGANGLGYEVNEFIELEQRGSISNNGLDQAEMNNRKQLNQTLLVLVQQSGEQPLPEETVEQFIRRVEITHYTQDVGENISRNTVVEVSEPTETVEIMGPDTSKQIEKIYGRQDSEWQAVKDRSVEDFINNKYDDSNLSQAEVDRNEELKELLIKKIKETGEFPESGGNFEKSESIEEYLIRTSKS